MRGNSNPPGILLSGPQKSLHPLNFLPGSHQHPEIAELRKEKSHKISTPPKLPKLPADLWNMAPLSIHSQRGTYGVIQADWKPLNGGSAVCSFGHLYFPMVNAGPKAQIYESLLCSLFMDFQALYGPPEAYLSSTSFL